jgi:UDP-GlcNAc:undecaprenyl-phosphate GlcNAc-1-phosphate transferase
LSNFYLIVLSSAIFFSIYLKKEFIAKKIGLVDIPDKKLKNHKRSTPVIGGIVFSLITILILITFIFKNYMENILFIKILLLSLTFSVIGIIDDIYKIKVNTKIFFTTLALLIFATLVPELRIKYIIFSDNFFIKNLNLENKIFLSTTITVLCYQLLIHAFNMADGHDGIASLMATSWIAYIYFSKNNFQFLVPYITVLLLFIYFNLKSKIFLGDSGNYFLSTLLASLIILNNNTYKNFLAEEIFIILMLPGIDMLRLFFIRIKNNKNPLFGDKKHLHHLLYAKFNKNNTTLVYFLLFITPIFFLYFKILSENYIIIFFLVIYVFIITKLKK